MYKQQFDSLLNQPLQMKSFLLYGESDYYLNKYSNLISEKIAADTVVKNYFEDYDYENVKTLLSQGSLFGEKSLFVLKSEKLIPKEELKSLIQICAKNDNSHFIFTLLSAKKPAITSLFTDKNSAVEVRFFLPNINQGIYELQLIAKKIDIDISRYSLEHLYLLLNMDLSLCENELSKLSILNKEVTIKDIDNLVYSTNSIKIENLFYDLMDQKPVTQHLIQLLHSGEDSFKILRQIQYFFQQLFMFRSYIALKGNVDSKEILGYKLPNFVEEKKASYAQKLKVLQYGELFKKLITAELELKKAQSIQKEPILLATILSLQSSMQ